MKDYVTISGKLKSKDIQTIIIQAQKYAKEIAVDSDGRFSDTLKIEDGLHYITDGTDGIMFFLRNGYDMNLEFVGVSISHGVIFEGIGAETNNFIENKRWFSMTKHANPKYYFNLDQADYDTEIAEAKSIIQAYKDQAPNLDSIVDKMDAQNDERIFK